MKSITQMNVEKNKNNIVFTITDMRYESIILWLAFVFHLESFVFTYWP